MRKWLPLILVAIGYGATAALWSRLPGEFPVHWNHAGEVDRYGSRLEGALLLPTVGLVLWGLFRVLPKIDPRRANYAKFEATYDWVIVLIVASTIVMHLMLLALVMGYPVSPERVFPALIGLLLIGIGNLLPRARSNWWFGIRTPWTLSDEHVWARTHRVGGYLFMLAGLVLLLAAAAPNVFPARIAIIVAVIVSISPVIYSYLIWRSRKA